jgi:hypothetical protein
MRERVGSASKSRVGCVSDQLRSQNLNDENLKVVSNVRIWEVWERILMSKRWSCRSEISSRLRIKYQKVQRSSSNLVLLFKMEGRCYLITEIMPHLEDQIWTRQKNIYIYIYFSLNLISRGNFTILFLTKHYSWESNLFCFFFFVFFLFN